MRGNRLLKVLLLALMLAYIGGLHKVLAWAAETEVYIVSGGFISVFLVYLIVNAGVAVSLLKKAWLFGAICVFSFWPVFTSIGHGNVSIDNLGRYLSYSVIFVSSIIVARKKDFDVVKVGFILALTYSIGIVLSWVYPTIFIAAREYITSLPVTYPDRALGIYLQPNVSASLLVLAISFLYSVKKFSKVTMVVTTLSTILILLLTGSRGSVLAFLLVTVITFFSYGLNNRSAIFGRYANALVKLVLLASILVSVPLIAETLKNSAEASSRWSDRIGFFSVSSEDFEGGNSITNRLYLNWAWTKKAAERPIIGHGFGSTDEVISSRNGIWNSSHNAIVRRVFLFGLVYTAALLGTLLYPLSLLNKPTTLYQEAVSKAPFVCATLLLSFTGNFIFDMNLFYLLFGFLVGNSYAS